MQHQRLYHTFAHFVAVGIGLDLGKDKYRTLITKSATKATFVSGLGKRIRYVAIYNDGKRVRVMQKGWLDKKIWREINDILSLYGFSWDTNDGRGFWIFLTNKSDTISKS